jgi:D-tyrosyl-tRNA(Tyr) deacylase
LRYFPDAQSRTNADIGDAGGAFLVISQFTLYAELRRGRRPGFTDAAAPELAARLVDRFVDALRALGHRVETGRFGASMQVELLNDGPFTLILDSSTDLGPAQ